eukprot:5779102-Pyramimonas_sp.AAC.1
MCGCFIVEDVCPHRLAIAKALILFCRTPRRSDTSAERSGAQKPLQRAQALRCFCRTFRQGAQAL